MTLTIQDLGALGELLGSVAVLVIAGALVLVTRLRRRGAEPAVACRVALYACAA